MTERSPSSTRLLLLLFLGLGPLSAGLYGCTGSNSEKSEESVVEIALPSKETSSKIATMCKDLSSSVERYKWKIPLCGDIQWYAERESVEGRPLIYAAFGEPTSKNRTLILSMVHPDEITPLYLGFELARHLKDNSGTLADAYVVVAPFVNPDGHFRKPPIRMNAKGVDVNRNFDTKDWRSKALQTWKGKLRKNPRRFPGHEPSSEPETKFQEDLISRFQPTKILSIHAPLNYMDYDGPSHMTLERFPKEYVQECLKLRKRLKARSTGHFPGSLGNYAGQEMGIPTITLELPSANSRNAARYWKQFHSGIKAMIDFRIEATEVARSQP